MAIKNNINDLTVRHIQHLLSKYFVTVVWIMLVFFISGCSNSPNNQESSNYERYEVNAPSQLIVRDQPSKQGSKIVSLPHKAIICVDTIENGWAHVVSDSYDGYVNVSYLEKVSENASLVNSVGGKESIDSDWSIKEFGEKYFPYFILACFILYFVMSRDGSPIVDLIFLIPLCISEIAYLLCISQWVDDWFLEPRTVGWIMTIIDYGLLLALAYFQGIGTFRAVRYSASGWFNNLLSLIFSLFTGLAVYALIENWTWDRSSLVLVALVAVMAAILVWVVQYSMEDWALTCKIVPLNVLLVTAYATTVYHFAWSILVAIGAFILSKVDGRSNVSHITITDGYGRTRTLEVSDTTPYRGRDISSGDFYERNNNDEWIKK